jgi:ubiquinone/menaquinone biosynthesis C-methylase UbiE
MELDEIYKKRFNEVEGRKHLWQILVHDYFQQFIKSTDVVLDMPCGYSEFINNVVCGRKIGLDLNPDSAKYIGNDVEFLKASSTAIPLKDATVDIVFISNFFEHLNHEDLLATISECYRVLRPDGKVLVLQPNIRFAYRDYWMFLDHTTPIDDRMLEEAFELGKFSLKKRVLRFLPFTAKSRIPQTAFLVKAYLKLPLAWRLLGKQTFMIFEK